MSHHGKGRDPEKLDMTPIAMPARCEVPESLESMVARMLYAERQAQSQEGYESPEEADDFDDSEFLDDLLDMSPYELPETLSEAAHGYEQLDPAPPHDEGAKAPENSSPAATGNGTELSATDSSE